MAFFLNEHLTLFGIASIVIGIFLGFAMLYNKIKVSKISYLLFISCLVVIYLYMVEIKLIDKTLFLLIIIGQPLSALLFINLTTNFKIKFYVSTTTGILSITASIYALFTINYFEGHDFLRIGLVSIYSLGLLLFIHSMRIRWLFIKSHKIPNEGYEIVNRNYGSDINLLPIFILIDNLAILILQFFLIVHKFSRNKFNAGVFESRSRASIISFNSDSKWLGFLLISIITLLLSKQFSTEALFIAAALISAFPIIRSFKGTHTTKYYTSVVGEKYRNRSNIYDSLLNRVLPENNLRKSKSDLSYSLFFHKHEFIYDIRKGVQRQEDIVSRGHHLIAIFNKNFEGINYYCEKDLIIALRSPLMIIDVWKVNHDLNQNYLFPKVTADSLWLEKRMNLLQKLTDEEFSQLHLENTKTPKSEKQRFKEEELVLMENIIKSSSFESLRININLLERHYNDVDKNRLKELEGVGIFEINSLFRQLHENPSVPSRFIDLLNVAECAARYIVGFTKSEALSFHENILSDLPFDTKAISFGTCVNYLAKYKNSANTPPSFIHNAVLEFLDKTYDDEINIKSLIGFMRKLNNNTKYSYKPRIIDLFWWLTEIRNKTRGHGTPSKVNFDFYVALEKLVLYLLHEFNKLKIKPIYIDDFEDEKWLFNLSYGGYPATTPIKQELKKGIHFNPLLSDSFIDDMLSVHHESINVIQSNYRILHIRIEQNGVVEWYKCREHFKISNGVLYILNQRNEKSESWISFTTGKIIKPEIIVLN